MANYERLSPLDASFLYWEKPDMHMHVGGVAIFEDAGFDLQDVYNHIEARLDLTPRFRRKVMWVPYSAGRPVWVDDPDFDVRYHVRHTGIPKPGTERELLQLIGRIMSHPLDRDRPLWELWIVDMPGDRKAMLHKTHHSLIDGVSGVDLATVLLDAEPKPGSVPERQWRPEPAPTKQELLRETIIERLTKPAEIIRSTRQAIAAPRAALEATQQFSRGLRNVGSKVTQAKPRTSLDTARLGQHRRYEVVRTNLDDVKVVKKRLGCTVNDVVLALVAGGLRHLLVSRGEDVDGLVMRATIPVSVRDESERMTFGNRVSVMFADLPVGEADFQLRIEAVQRQMSDVKDSQQALAADTIIGFAEYAPPTLIALAGRAVARQWVMNLIVTNVPGPQFPLYFLGGRVLEIHPFVPLVGGIAVGAAVLSYDGTLGFGLSGDWDAVPDLDLFAEGIEKSLEEMLAG